MNDPFCNDGCNLTMSAVMKICYSGTPRLWPLIEEQERKEALEKPEAKTELNLLATESPTTHTP